MWVLLLLFLVVIYGIYKYKYEDYSVSVLNKSCKKSFGDNGNAVICASEGIDGEDDAKTICSSSCKNAGMLWNGQWVGTSNVSCDPDENIEGSLCGCYTTIVCATEEIGGNYDAKSICDPSCNMRSMLWTGNWTGTTNSDCGSNNDSGSICACYVPCQCINGKQIDCTNNSESCKSNCDCPVGKSCKQVNNNYAVCEDIVCCDNCALDVLSCDSGCAEDNSGDPNGLAGCLLACELQWLVDKRNCGGCPDQNVSLLLG